MKVTSTVYPEIGEGMVIVIQHGGEGSGFSKEAGHKGRPGEVGGSSSSESAEGAKFHKAEPDASKVILYQGRGIKGLPLENEDGYIYATTNRDLAKTYSGVVDESYPYRDIPIMTSTMRGEIRTVDFQTNNPLIIEAKITHGSRDLEREIIEKAKLSGYDSVIFYDSAGGDTYVTWEGDKVKLIESKTDDPFTRKYNT